MLKTDGLYFYRIPARKLRIKLLKLHNPVQAYFILLYITDTVGLLFFFFPNKLKAVATLHWVSLSAKRLWLAEGSDNGQQFLALKYFLIKACTLFWTYCFCTLNRLQYSVNITSYEQENKKNSCESVYCDIWFIAVVCNQTQGMPTAEQSSCLRLRHRSTPWDKDSCMQWWEVLRWKL